MALLEKWKSSRHLDRFRSEFDDLLERFGFDRDWFAAFLWAGNFLLIGHSCRHVQQSIRGSKNGSSSFMRTFRASTRRMWTLKSSAMC